MKKILLFLGLSCCLLSCNKDDVIPINTEAEGLNDLIQTGVNSLSPGEAQEVADIFYSRAFGDTFLKKSRSTNVSPINNDQNVPVAYVVNNADGGWVIVSATTDYYPILAFSESGQFTLDSNKSYGLKIWIDETILAIEESDKLDNETSSIIAAEWLQYTSEIQIEQLSGPPGGNSPEAVMCRNRMKELNETYYTDGWSFRTLSSFTGMSIPDQVYSIADQVRSPYEYTIVGIKDVSSKTTNGPLLTTKWDQEKGFNELCPNKHPAGCAAIAMAQIMKFHKYPSSFDWNSMPDDYATYASQYLIADIGKTIGINYGPEGSEAKYYDIPIGFIAYGYQSSLKEHNSSDVASEIIKFKRPVCMTGVDPLKNEGHAWVCDGVEKRNSNKEYYVEYVNNGKYDNLGYTLIDNPGSFGYTTYSYFHMNMGWDGTDDGWYLDNNVLHPTNRKDIYVSIN
ncbi:C10 family peptidase [Phocaeicola coprophilus]|uniref:C10 family peptidase n=1 Tax=Phocaeicola coprophilus TaxID=387090 RepID=UPI0024327671|nr:C10 family peptidase [Phocaeicola coprophilus]